MKVHLPCQCQVTDVDALTLVLRCLQLCDLAVVIWWAGPLSFSPPLREEVWDLYFEERKPTAVTYMKEPVKHPNC